VEIFYAPRQSGKTHQCILEAHKTGAYIVCRRDAVDMIAERAREMKLSIRFPLSYHEFLERRYYARGISSFIIDDAEEFLQCLTRVPISMITMSSTDRNIGKIE
jgi:hypothetical protein